MTDTLESFEEPLPDNLETIPVAPILARRSHQSTNTPASANDSAA
jgi:hypothetical protein